MKALKSNLAKLLLKDKKAKNKLAEFLKTDKEIYLYLNSIRYKLKLAPKATNK